MALSTGARLGPYEILSAIGAGGMGEVYKARDTRLDRTVAIKVLPPEFSADSDRRARFEREAKTIAGLNHPHICTLHDVGEHASTGSGPAALYLVMEHLQGQTLADRLAKEALPFEQALSVATDIADALASAHRQGVIHRDLKPANVMLTKGGAKLLDFGLAKLTGHGEQPAAASLASVPTRTRPLTSEGMIVGTLQYMAPEQLEGKPADARSDLWALGAILYEMLTGRRAFQGGTAASLIANIMNAEPLPLATLQPVTPPALDRLVAQCLRKDPEDRWAAAHDVADELRWIQHGRQTAAAPPTAVGRSALRAWILACSCLAAGILIGVVAAQILRGSVVRGTPGLPGQVVRGVLELPTDASLALKADSLAVHNATLMAVSPDGRRVAFVGLARGGVTQLYVRDLDTAEVRPVPHTEGALHPFFSPDGRSLGFLTADKVRTVPVNGGPAVTVCDARIPTRASWTRDGLIYVGTNDGRVLCKVSEKGGPLSPVIDLGSGGSVSQVLSEGRFALIQTSAGLSRDYARIELLSLETLSREPLGVIGYDARVVASGHLLFLRGGNLMAAPLDLGRGRLLGEPALAVSGVATDSMFGWGQFAVSESGLLVFAPGTDRALGKLVAVDRVGKVQPLRAPEGLYGPIALSPDGKRLAVQVGELNDQVLIFDLDRQEPPRKLLVEGSAGWPIWSPDGQKIAVRLVARPEPGIYTVPVSGNGPSERILDVARPWSWSRDGKWLAFTGGQGKVEQGVVQPMGERKVVPVPGAMQIALSPDGRFGACLLLDTGDSEIWIRSIVDPTFKQPLSVDGGVEPIWTGDHIYYRRSRQWFAARVTSLEPRVEWESPQPAFEADLLDTPGISYAVSPDGERLFVVTSAHEPAESKLVFMLNWFEELALKVPVKR